MTNQFRKCLAVVTVAVIAAIVAPSAQAQRTYDVEYCLPVWKTLHFDDSNKANLHYKTVKGLGCEAKQGAHAGHVDVSYRCASWRRISLATDESAHSWERWLRASGFQTRHQH